MKRIVAILAVTAGLALGSPARSDNVLVREGEVARAAFPEGSSVARLALELSDVELSRLEKLVARRTQVRRYPYLEVKKGTTLVGVVFLLDVIGQDASITFGVAISPAGVLRSLDVMVYREPRGEEIREPRFRRQFIGKRLSDPIALGKDVDAISGATISSNAATFAARKALALAELARARREMK